MSRILQDFAQAVDEISERRAPYNTKGAQPRTQVNETRLEEIHSLIHRPAFSLSDLVNLFISPHSIPRLHDI